MKKKLTKILAKRKNLVQKEKKMFLHRKSFLAEAKS